MKKISIILILVLLLCTLFILSIGKIQTPTSNNNTTVTSSTSNSQSTQRIYKIVNSIPEQSFVNKEDRQIWDFFTQLIPKDIVSQIKEFEVIDAPENSLVGNIVGQPQGWKLKVNTDKIHTEKNLNTELLKYTFIHELGHMLTLNNNEIDIDYKYLKLKGTDFEKNFSDNEKLCQPNYYLQEGCSKTDSVINLYWQEFWKPLWSEYLEIQKITDNDTFMKKSTAFCDQHQDYFASRVACQNPEEDLAEIFAGLILGKENKSKIIQKKLDFLAKFDRLTVYKSIIK
ncbi:MAG: hypothetical protein WCK98_01005 [bacterium]